VETKDDAVQIELGRAKYSLRTYSVVDYPKLPPIPAAQTEVAALELISGLSQVARASSNDEARPLLTGVLFTSHEGNLRVVATDSYRLAVRDLPGVNALATSDLLVPAKAVTELQRACTNLTVGSEIGVAHSDAEIHFTAGNQVISSRLIDGSYPDYKQLIPVSYPNSLRVGKDTILSSLGRIRVLARDTSSSVRLRLHASGVDVSTTSADQGDVNDNVDGDYRGEEMTVAFNPAFLMEGIEAAPGDEVILETSDPTRPAMVHGVEDTTFRYLQMPVRVQ
jgi:DNA polymerase-3 subunit beta